MKLDTPITEKRLFLGISWIVVLFLALGCAKEFGHTPRQKTREQLRCLGLFIVTESIHGGNVRFRLPEGDITTLEDWLSSQLAEAQAEGREHYLEISLGRASRLVQRDSSGKIRLVDRWGNRVRYECPASDPALMFRLYSVGPDGLDNGGGMDDIDGSRTYKSMCDYFEDPNFDGETYRKYKGRLFISQGDGKFSRPVIRYPRDQGTSTRPP